MNSIAELIAALHADELQLPALLGALAARGALPESGYQAEVALVERLRDAGEMDADIAVALLDQLAVAQTPVPSAPVSAVADEDVTMVVRTRRPPRPPVPPTPPADDDATVVQPEPRRPRTPDTADAPDAPVDDVTVVKPASRPSTDEQATGTTGTTSTTGVTGTQGRTGTSSSSSFNRASWQRVADAEGGDYAVVGMVLKGRFHLEREIGRGGMGVVFLAQDERKVEARDRDPYVAVKVLNDEFRRHPDSLIALQRESRRSQKLAHDNIVRVYDFDKDRTIVFMTMEYIDGSDLKHLIRERAYNGLPLAEARPLIEGMARALDRAHGAGVVHSDFKPGNVMVTREGVAKVFDFGIARAGKHLGDAVGEETVFDAGTLGALTPAYASLEMIRGEDPAPPDDIYAFGCVVFELLTGKHPFDKVSAEVALNEGRKPPPVPGLTRRQYKALCDSIAFTRAARLKSASALVEGLRDVGWRERLGPYLMYGAIAAVVLGAGGWGLNQYLHGQHVARVIAGFAPGGAGHYANEDQALQALDGLAVEDRTRLVVDQGDAIEGFLLGRVAAYWDPAQQRYDYAKAQHVFDLRDRLKLYSPKLDIRRSAMEQQKNELLNTLDTQLAQRIEAGALFEHQADNVVTTLAQIRAIDPDSTLLHNPELELKYDAAIGRSLGADQVAEARTQWELASRLFPASARLQRRQAQLNALGASAAAVAGAGTARASTLSLPEARKSLAALIAAPAEGAQWQNRVAEAMAALREDASPETRRLVDALGSAIATQAGRQTDPLHLPQARALVAFGLQYVPQSTPLLAQRGRLDALVQQQQVQLDQESTAAEVASRIESLKRAAAANDTTKAQESLARIRTLQPDNAFLARQGPQLVANAYLGQAQEAFRRGRLQGAVAVLAQATKALGERTDVRNASDRYELASTLLNARGRALDAAGHQRLTRQLAAARKADAEGLNRLEADMKLHGQLTTDSLQGLLDTLKADGSSATAAAPGVSPAVTPAPAAPEGTKAVAEAARPAPAAPGKPVATSTPAGAAATAPTVAAAAGPDPCGNPALVGKARSCYDAVDGRRGPALVVVAGVGGGKSYALSRTEITVSEFNRFCNATHKCTAAAGDAEGGSLPITNISLAQANAYASWLGSASGGFVYRLPTDTEWLHAAQAGGGWKQAPDSNCVPPTAGGDDGSGGPISARGREANPWGLVNVSGNVWEWVTGGGTAVRGGSFTSYWSDCTVASRRDDSGAPQKDVGFRILRELK